MVIIKIDDLFGYIKSQVEYKAKQINLQQSPSLNPGAEKRFMNMVFKLISFVCIVIVFSGCAYQSVTFKSIPEKADIYVNGIPQGKAPATVSLLTDRFAASTQDTSHTITAKLDGYQDEVIVMKSTSFFMSNTNPFPDVVEIKLRKATVSQENNLLSAPQISSDVDDVSAITIKQGKHGRYAIVIGIEHYRQKLPKAEFATRDAQIMTEYLTKVMGYPEENVITLLNDRASNVDLVKYFEKWLPNNVENGSSVFIYFSGHGAPNPKTGEAYLVPYDGDPSFIAQTGYPLKRMYEALGKLPAKEIIVALDSCFSGAGGRSVIAKGARPLLMNLQGDMALSKNMTVLSASSGDQISSTYDEKGHGLFTYFMLKGIKNEDVVKPDGSIKMNDLFDYLKPQVERIARKQFNNEQTPQLIGLEKK